MSFFTYTDKNNYLQPKIGNIVASIGMTLALLVTGGMIGCPQYRVWPAEKAGEAELAQAEQNRRIAVQEAQAKLDSAKLQAQAEVERAKGVAEANRIIADGLHGHSEYLEYLWIDKVAGNSARELIYVPTEAGIPIIEAGRGTQERVTPDR